MEVAERAQEAPALEAENVDYRIPKRPNKRALLKGKYAVIMLAWKPDQYGDEPAKPADRDMEVFDSLEHAKKYFGVSATWAKEDFDNHGDLWHATIMCFDTGKAFEDGEGEDLVMLVAGGTAKWGETVEATYKGDPKAIFSLTRRERIQREHAVVKHEKREPIKRVGLKKPNAKKAVAKKVARNSAAPIRQDVKKPRRVKKPNAKQGA